MRLCFICLGSADSLGIDNFVVNPYPICSIHNLFLSHSSEKIAYYPLPDSLAMKSLAMPQSKASRHGGFLGTQGGTLYLIYESGLRLHIEQHLVGYQSNLMDYVYSWIKVIERETAYACCMIHYLRMPCLEKCLKIIDSRIVC